LTDLELATVGDAVDALTNPFTSRTKVDYWHGNNRRTRVHEARFPSLLRQLEAAKRPGEVYVEPGTGGGHGKPGSRPPARLEAIHLELAISLWAADMVWKARRPVREATVANLRALVGAYPAEDSTVLGRLRGWVGSAKVLAGWSLPPRRLEAPCPQCNTVNSLRVRLDESTACCVECRATWDASTIPILGEHVRRVTQATVREDASAVMIAAGSTTMPAAG